MSMTILPSMAASIDCFSPDASVLAAESTLNSNDVRLKLVGTGGSTFRIYVFLKYQASLALYPGNEVRLLDT